MDTVFIKRKIEKLNKRKITESAFIHYLYAKALNKYYIDGTIMQIGSYLIEGEFGCVSMKKVFLPRNTVNAIPSKWKACISEYTKHAILCLDDCEQEHSKLRNNLCEILKCVS